MFQRMFGRRRSPVEGESGPVSAVEATEERPDEINCDGFIVLGMYSTSSVYHISFLKLLYLYTLTCIHHGL